MKSFDLEEFESEEDLLRSFDDLVYSIAEDVKMDEAEPAVIDPVKVYQVKFVHAAMKYITKGTTAKVTYKLHEPFRTVGSVSVECDNLMIRDSLWFRRAAQFATNMEIYPLVNGKFRLTFTFHGLVKKLR